VIENTTDPLHNLGSLRRYAWLSIGAAIVTIGMKLVAYWITDSVGLLSDAIESFVNLAAAIMALAMITVAERPPDVEHAYGHGKAEYFSSSFEGAMILFAAATIAWTAVHRLLDPQPVENVGIGLMVSIAASLVNLAVALVLGRAGKRYNSITLEADAKHLMTDVWTSVGVVVGVAAVAVTGWEQLDPIIALLVAANILWSGIQILRKSVLGLMDAGLPAADMKMIGAVLDSHREEKVEFHALRTRQSGARRFISLHIMTPGFWTIQRGHDLAERIEAELRATLPGSTIFTHIEPIEDPTSLADITIDRR
jgi:cation diffusion facilitator family transporter